MKKRELKSGFTLFAAGSSEISFYWQNILRSFSRLCLVEGMLIWLVTKSAYLGAQVQYIETKFPIKQARTTVAASGKNRVSSIELR